MASTDALAFWTVFLILFLLNAIIPSVSIGLNENYISHDTDNFETTPPILTNVLFVTGFNILAVPFWTFGLNAYINIFILIPLRVLGWYLLLRLARGN